MTVIPPPPSYLDFSDPFILKRLRDRLERNSKRIWSHPDREDWHDHDVEYLLTFVEDAIRWRALIACGRIRTIGSTGLDYDGDRVAPRPGEGYAHLGVEFWTTHHAAHEDKYPQTRDRAALAAVVDFMITKEAEEKARKL